MSRLHNLLMWLENVEFVCFDFSYHLRIFCSIVLGLSFCLGNFGCAFWFLHIWAYDELSVDNDCLFIFFLQMLLNFPIFLHGFLLTLSHIKHTVLL